jgi:hypothetical protein
VAFRSLFFNEFPFTSSECLKGVVVFRGWLFHGGIGCWLLVTVPCSETEEAMITIAASKGLNQKQM